MPRNIKPDINLRSELQGVYKVCTNEENKDIAVAIATELQKADNFNMIKAWIQNTLPESNESDMQRKVIDILCNTNILNELPNDIKNFVVKTSAKVQKVEKIAMKKSDYFNNIKDKLDKLINKTQVLCKLFNKSNNSNCGADENNNENNIVFNNFVMDAVTMVWLATVILVAHYQNGML